MAINLDDRYPGRTNPADANYPQGSFKNRSAPDVLDGSYLEKDWANDQFAFFQQALVEAGITPNGTVDNATNSQYYEALKTVFALKSEVISLSTTAFEASVTDGEAVHWDAANSRFDEAIADGTVKQNMIGFADVTNSRVILLGQYSGQLSGLTGGVKYYLSSTVAGAISTTFSTVLVGVARTSTSLYVNVNSTSNLATDTVVGVARNANQSEVNAGTAGNFTVTPEKLRFGFSINLSANGHIAFPSWMGGFVINWLSEVVESANNSSPRDFSFPFPNECFVAVATAASSATEYATQITSITQTGFVLRVGNTYGNGNTANVIALGR